jgi:hypothetical protein
VKIVYMNAQAERVEAELMAGSDGPLVLVEVAEGITLELTAERLAELAGDAAPPPDEDAGYTDLLDTHRRAAERLGAWPRPDSDE